MSVTREQTPHLDARTVIVYGKLDINDTTGYPIAVDSLGNLYVNRVSPGGVVSGSQTVAVSGSAVKLAASATPCLYVEISADTGNADVVAVGDSDVNASPGSQKGLILFAGNPAARIYIDDVSKLYVDAASNGDKVSFNYYTK